MDPPHGRMNCSGLVTNETCWFRCEDGYELQGSEKRTCLNSSKWDGQQASCTGNGDFYLIQYFSELSDVTKQSFTFRGTRIRAR